MYGQFQNSVASAAKWVFIGFMVIILMALLLGADLKNSKWLNPDIAAAEANQMNIETQHQQEMYQLEQRLSTAKTEAEIREIQRQQGLLDAQYARDIQALNLDLAHQDLAFRTLMTIITMTAGALAITLAIISTMWAGARVLTYVRSGATKENPMTTSIPPIEKKIFSREPYDPWNSPAFRRSKRMEAQQEERQERKERKENQEIALRMMSFRDPGKISTEEFKKIPHGR